jgi:hypothetical protein
MTQLGLLEGLRRRDSGLDAAEHNNRAWVDQIRDLARLIARSNGSVSTDDLRPIADRKGLAPSSPNAWGSVFRGGEWKCIGRRKSTYRTNNAREIRVWALR